MSASGSSRLKKGKKKGGAAYSGPLNKPIQVTKGEPPTFLAAAGGSPSEHANQVAENSHVPKEWLEKMALLLSHYKIDADDPERWFALSLHLAIDHVPGFKLDEKKKSGAPLDWDGWTLARLNFEVSDLMARNVDMTIEAACETILSDSARRRSYPIGTGGKPVSTSTLMRRYHSSQNNPLVRMFQRMAAQSEAMRKIVIAEIFAGD